MVDMVPKARYGVRTQAAFVRAYKFLNGGSSDRTSTFNIRSMNRLHDMNPPIFVCALTLLDAGVPEEPTVIREHPQFRNLIDHLGLQPSTTSRDVRNGYKASLILLEVFTYMIMIHRARTAEEADKTASREASGQLYEEEELTA
jgi:hypothetical protein